MRSVRLLAAVGVAVAGALLVAPSPAYAAEIGLSPVTGPAGGVVVVKLGGFTDKCPEISILWDGVELASVPSTAGSAEFTVPAAAPPGQHVVYATQPQCQVGARAPFEVIVVRPSPSPTPTPTQPTPTAKPTPPASKPPTPTTPSGPPPTPAPSSSPSPMPSATPSRAATPTPSPSGQLSLDRDNVRPGEPLTATGTGCVPGSPVVLTSGAEQVGWTIADSAGAFVAPVQFSRLEPGRRAVTASCGTVLTTSVDLIVSSSTSGQAGTVVVLIFFVLVGIALLRWQYRGTFTPDR
jgi:outer membrane biosynthesis protein TonB